MAVRALSPIVKELTRECRRVGFYYNRINQQRSCKRVLVLMYGSFLYCMRGFKYDQLVYLNQICRKWELWVRIRGWVMVLNAAFNNISVISWQ